MILEMIKKLLLILIIFVISSCTTRQEHEASLNSWIGAKESLLIEKWGTLTSHYKTEDGKKYLTWKNSSQALVGGYAPTISTDYFGNVYSSGGMPPILVTSNCDITMILTNGLVSSWSYKGNNCYDY